MKHIRTLLALVTAVLALSACEARQSSSDLRVQSERIYLRDRATLQTCWLTGPSTLRYALNDYAFYFFEQDGDQPCADGLPEGAPIYRFDRQFQPELAIRIIEDLKSWQAHDPDLSFLTAVPECSSNAPSLEIDLISFPAITRASEIYVDFAIMCPERIEAVRARIGFSYDDQVQSLGAEDAVVIWQ
jgi:hypothetical protein